ncbi:hypothetical protein [Comamonas sp. JC664]|uniref:hypothetical protein n=1 Tax=Comamonas sp. JC664 TaxID=2801917 RepID=UPI003611B750
MRADANFRGTVDFSQSDKGPVLHIKGDAGLDDVRVRPLVAAAARPAVMMPVMTMAMAPARPAAKRLHLLPTGVQVPWALG